MKRTLTLPAIAIGVMLASCTQNVPAGLTEPLDSGLWSRSEWISAADAPVVSGIVNDNTRAADGASWFLSTVRNEKKLLSAKWMTTGLGVYELYVNGSPVGKEVLKPGFTDYLKTKISYTYDITSLLSKGKGAANTLSAQVTPGWWADKIVTYSGSEGMIGKRCAFRGILELTYNDGEKQYFGTDTENWTAGVAGPVTHAAIFDGEEYDARIPMGWQTPEKLSKPTANDEFKGEILPTAGAEIYHRDDISLSPVAAYIWQGVTDSTAQEYGKVRILREYQDGEEMTVGPGETLVVDFGQNAAAVPDFLFSAAEGSTLTCLPSELLNDGNGSKERGMDGPEGSVHRRNLRTPDTAMRLVYTFGREKGFVSYRPTHTFFGYRLLSITATGQVRIKKLLSVPVSSITRDMETGHISTGNELINKLISNTLWGQRSNYLSVSTDCPQRNERLGWTADTQVFTETGSFFANTDRFFHKWTRDLRDSQSPAGGFPGVAPRAQYGTEPTSMMRLGWADAGVIVPWTVWKQFGDTSIIDENWEAMERFISHVNETKYDHQALSAENGNYQWADWLSYEPLESHSGITDSKGLKSEVLEYWNYLCASYWAIDASMMSDMARATGRDASLYEKMTEEARDYLRERFLLPDGTFKTPILNTMQTPQLFALKNSLVDAEAKEAMKARLRQNFEEHDGCLQTGFLGTSILMGVLTDNDMSDIAYTLLFQRKNPSWLYSVDNGATTIWERWNSYTKDKGMGPAGMNSFNHYAYGCVCEWLWKTAAGIAADPAMPGFRHIIMSPVPDKRLGFLKAEFQSAAGLIRSEWNYDGDEWIWTFTIPEGATATVTLPGESQGKEYSSGTYTLRQ